MPDVLNYRPVTGPRTTWWTVIAMMGKMPLGLIRFVWLLVSLILAIEAATKLLLINHYGWERVRREHLSILRLTKGHTWPVSNGDHISNGGGGLFFLTIFLWFAMVFGTAFIFDWIWRCCRALARDPSRSAQKNDETPAD